MKEKSLIKALSELSLFLLILIVTIQLITAPIKGEDNITVPDDYTSIQLAIDNANNGDTIFVKQGTYFENVIINKSITLIGENKITTILNGKGSGNIITISAPSVTIQGFTIQNAGNDGIHINSNTNHIFDNILSNNDNYGIFLTFSHYTTISGNTISNNERGIRLDDSNYNNVTNNLIKTNSGNAMYLSNSVNTNISGNEISYNEGALDIWYSSDNNMISDNIISYNDDGIYCHDCNSNIIEHNEFTWNEGCGISFVYSTGNNLSNNIISNGQWGIKFSESSFNTIIQNNITDNSRCGLYTYSGTSNNFIYHNNFIENDEHVIDTYENNWDNEYSSGGNYWDDYNGIDANGDGIGDTPYNISDGENQDRYPLIEPWKGKVQSDPKSPNTPTPLHPGSIDEPGESIDTLTPTFQWNEVPNADYYAFYISQYPYGSENLVFDSETDVGSIYETSFSLPIEILEEGIKYRWNMRAYNSDGGSEFSYRLYFFVSSSPKEFTEGIDVSSYQGEINWTSVYRCGYRFAFIKATAGDNRSPQLIDTKFTTNIRRARNAGLLVGAYHYAYPQYNSAEDEALFFVDIAGEYISHGYLRPALDLEEGGNTYSPQELSNWIHAWMNVVKNLTGVEPLLYLNSNYSTNCVDESVTKYDLWIAHWACDFTSTPNIGPWATWSFWQYYGPGEKTDYSNGCGFNSVDGIEDPDQNGVDLDVFNGNWDKLSNFLINDKDETFNEKTTPGFEFLLVLFAFLIIIFRKQKN